MPGLINDSNAFTNDNSDEIISSDVNTGNSINNLHDCNQHPIPHDTQPNDLHICLMNTRSLVNKLSNFQSFICSSDFSTSCITETWLYKDVFDNEIIPNGYTIYRKDRDSRGGGVLLAVKDNITSSQLSSPPNVEILTVLISTLKSVLFTFLQTLVIYILTMNCCIVTLPT